MKGIKLLAILLALCCAIAVLAACNKTEEPDPVPSDSESDPVPSDSESEQEAPVEPVTLPQTPLEVKKRSFLAWDEEHHMETIKTYVEITKITYEIKEDDLHLSFTGENLVSGDSTFDWILYDQDGKQVESGSFKPVYRNSAKTFENKSLIIENVIEAGKIYRFEIKNVVE